MTKEQLETIVARLKKEIDDRERENLCARGQVDAYAKVLESLE